MFCYLNLLLYLPCSTKYRLLFDFKLLKCMAKLQCANSNGYSSPVPIIGLYIAIASLACLLLMLYDILFAIRRKNRHIPCRRFSLNSVTISLLAIVAKLPLDLTTNMPSARDQLSKLSGTAMSCVCIDFMAPSIASSKESESVSNMASLSIFVVTVAVNICIQLALDVLSEPHISLLLYLPDGPTILESIRHFLAQLPNCVFKQVNDGSVEDCEERARFIAKHLCELPSSLEDKVQWKVPVGFPNTPHFFDSPQDHLARLPAYGLHELEELQRDHQRLQETLLKERMERQEQMQRDKMERQEETREMQDRLARMETLLMQHLGIRPHVPPTPQTPPSQGTERSGPQSDDHPGHLTTEITPSQSGHPHEHRSGHLISPHRRMSEDQRHLLDDHDEFMEQLMPPPRPPPRQEYVQRSRLICVLHKETNLPHHLGCKFQRILCASLMLWDIFFAMRRKARYIPCRLFSLNSVTLTLLAIVAKLPVDLTTHMPSARDQLSKLSGTAMSCICVGFMAPSFASNEESENVSNMASLSIFVVTVADKAPFVLQVQEPLSGFRDSALRCIPCKWFALNSAALTLLAIASKLPVDLTTYTPSAGDHNQSLLAQPWPQFDLSSIIAVGGLAAAFRSMAIVFDPPSRSDSAATEFDVKPLMQALDKAFEIVHYIDEKINVGNSQDGMKRRLAKILLALKYIPCTWFSLNSATLALLAIASKLPVDLTTYMPRAGDQLSKLTGTTMKLSKLFINAFGNFQDGMKRRFAKVLLALKNVHLSKNDSSAAHLDTSVNEAWSSITNEMKAFPDGLAKREMEIIRDFVHGQKYASIGELHKDLEQLLVDEAIDIVYYIDRKINVGNFQDGIKRRIAKILLAHKNFLLRKKDSNACLDTSVNEALSSIENEWNAFPDGLAHREIAVIMDFISVQEYASIEELYEDLEQLFVDMLVDQDAGGSTIQVPNVGDLDVEIAIESKLPVDLTTHMPSARDQLSKLSGTAMSCICVDFMAPFFASNEESENVSNMASLSIFVVTVAVNI
ncbi:hypothetical protein Syun_005944 [Stephania yunnanensis]|uniref:Uncharacterized protein n=1 Tax=Stephania yunnanensis TaxID=152371 RepID=A0AAP0KX59_9MAGN